MQTMIYSIDKDISKSCIESTQKRGAYDQQLSTNVRRRGSIKRTVHRNEETLFGEFVMMMD